MCGNTQGFKRISSWVIAATTAVLLLAMAAVNYVVDPGNLFMPDG